MSGCKLCLLEHAAAGDDVLGSVCVELEQAKQEIERLRARIAELEERRSETAAMCSQLEAEVNTYQKAAAYWWTQYWVAKGMNPPPPRTTDTNWQVIMDCACEAQARISELEEVAHWAQAMLTALNVGDVQSESPLHLKLREVMIAYRAAKAMEGSDE